MGNKNKKKPLRLLEVAASAAASPAAGNKSTPSSARFLNPSAPSTPGALQGTPPSSLNQTPAKRARADFSGATGNGLGGWESEVGTSPAGGAVKIVGTPGGEEEDVEPAGGEPLQLDLNKKKKKKRKRVDEATGRGSLIATLPSGVGAVPTPSPHALPQGSTPARAASAGAPEDDCDTPTAAVPAPSSATSEGGESSRRAGSSISSATQPRAGPAQKLRMSLSNSPAAHVKGGLTVTEAERERHGGRAFKASTTDFALSIPQLPKQDRKEAMHRISEAFSGLRTSLEERRATERIARIKARKLRRASGGGGGGGGVGGDSDSGGEDSSGDGKTASSRGRMDEKAGALRSLVCLGLNEVTRHTARGEVSLVLVCKDAQPPALLLHLASAAYVHGAKVCGIGETSEALGAAFGAPCAMAVAFFTEDAQAARVPNELREEVGGGVVSMTQFISARAPELYAPWLAQAQRAAAR